MNEDIYAIYRACRLCGVGAGYKMPIIQSMVDVDEGTELRQKIKDCVQIEVTLSDKMPPLICELCVDKIHDFYEFRKMCQETNKKTRLRLGLSSVQTSRKTPAAVSILEDSDSDEAEPLIKQTKRPQPRSTKTLKEPDVKTKAAANVSRLVSTDALVGKMRAALVRHLGGARPPDDHKDDLPIVVDDSRSPSPGAERRDARRSPSPKRVTRQNKPEGTVLTELQEHQMMRQPPRARPGPRSATRARDSVRPTSDDEIEDNPLLVPRQKRPREVALESHLAVKRTKMFSESTKPEKCPRPGPKSSKEPPQPAPPLKPTPPPPKAGPKSKKRDSSSPAPKSQKPESTSKSKSECQESKSRKPDAAAAAKSKSKRETLTSPAPKSKKSESSIPTPKLIKKSDLVSPGAPAPDRAPPPPGFAPKCKICGVRVKSPQGLASHIKAHVPAYTPAKLACNACEVWFTSSVAAAAHHRRHAEEALPYRCTRCYDDFRTADDYEMHFARNQCVRTYEAPDVKCEECWKLFPTYKLLEDHRCQGQGARPGGKCDNCKRTYATLKGLTMHEIRCTTKRKVVSEAEAELQRDVLPMRVRLVRCDALLDLDQGTCHVAGLPTKFGLDRSCTYPYLAMAEVKTEPAFDHMVTINDEIKREFLERDEKAETHWDSDDSDGDNRSTSNKSVDSLSAISLKTLFSPDCLGKVPKRQRNAKSEIESDSIVGNDSQQSIRGNIDNIIDDLANDIGNNDNDSLLDKVLWRKDDVNAFESLKTTRLENSVDETKEICISISETSKIDNDNIRTSINDNSDENMKRINQSQNDVDSSSSRDETNCNVTKANVNEELNNSPSNDDNLGNAIINSNIQNDTNDQSTTDSRDEKNCKKDNENIDDSQTTLDNSTEPDNSRKYSDDSTTTNNCDMTTDDAITESNDSRRNNTKNGHVVSNKTLNESQSLENKTVQPKLDIIDVDQKLPEINNANINNSVDSADVEMIESAIEKPDNTKDENTSKTIEGDKVTNVESQSCHGLDDKQNAQSDSKCVVNDKTNSDSYMTSYDDTKEKNDSSHAINDKQNINHDSSVNDDTTKHSTNSSSQNDASDADRPYTESDEINQNEDSEPNLVDPKDSLITEKDLFDTENAHSVHKLDMNYLDDEDKMLMAELDAQIGENESENRNSDVSGENSDVSGVNSNVIGENSNVIKENSEFGSKYCDVNVTNEGFSEDKNATLEGFINKQSDLRSLELDSISDEEFDFDL